VDKIHYLYRLETKSHQALRANEDGTTFEQIMDWEKVEED
jgi:hypothetical protein